MKIAFYAPLKPPGHPRPSGDRRLARNFIAALKLAGSKVEVASELRAWEGDGDAHRQAEIAAQGEREAARLLAEYRARAPADRPRIWFTYHLYHKAPDWIGPAVSAAFGIPYIVAEASVAASQRAGAWRRGYAQSLAALARADVIFNLNSNDLAGIKPHAGDARIVRLKPFADLPAPAADKSRLRRELAARYSVAPGGHWLVCAAMFRAGDKSASYRILADAVARLKRDDWQLLVAGDGAAAGEVKAGFAGCRPGRVHFLGRLDAAAVYELMRAGDLFVWPARNEAFGMAALEALGCGLPVVAGIERAGGGIADIVESGVTGILVNNPNGASFAAAMENLLDSPGELARMAAASQDKFNRNHRLDRAAEKIRAAVAAAVN